MGEPNIFSKGFYTIILLLALDDFTKRTTSTSSSLFYPYGSLSNDTTAPKSDDGVNGPITLSTKLTLFGNASTIIYVNNNGLLSFNASIAAYTPKKLPELNGSNPFVAPFWADVNNAVAGDIYYRQSNDTDLLSRATSDICSYFSLPTFSATWAFVATWSNVAYFGSTASSSTVNTFQAVLITNASLTFAMFNYASIHWTTGTSSGGDSKGTGGTPALAGVNSGYKVGYYQIASSLTSEIINISSTSNVNVPGRWVFKLDKLYPEDPGGIIGKTKLTKLL
ncbi:sushi, nidogen and EGF-like domain-containing protein 1 [Lithobates pipiens]